MVSGVEVATLPKGSVAGVSDDHVIQNLDL